MKEFGKNVTYSATSLDTLDQGLKSYMLRVYNYMFLGLLLTAVTSYLAITLPVLQNILFSVNENGYVVPSMMTWVLFAAQIGVVFYLSSRINHMESSTAQLLFWAYAGIMGLSLSPILMTYTYASVGRMFLVTSAVFGSMSLYGYTTKKDLSSLGSFFLMGVIGIMIASLANMFFKSSMVEFVVSVLGVIIFTGLAAYDTQKIKESYWEQDSAGDRSKKAVMGALNLYLDFINLFLMMLRLLGNRR